MAMSVSKNLIGVLFAGIAMTSCISSIDSGVDLADRLQDDSDYYKAMQDATRGGDLIRNFELNFRIHATYLYPEFRVQLAKRMKEIYLQDVGAFAEADAKSGFFVTVFGTERDSADLANTNHWSVLLDTKDGPVRPVLVRKITDKMRWRNFFETVSPWSVDYLVVFDTAAANPGASNLVEKPHAKLTIANSEGKVVLDW